MCLRRRLGFLGGRVLLGLVAVLAECWRGIVLLCRSAVGFGGLVGRVAAGLV